MLSQCFYVEFTVQNGTVCHGHVVAVSVLIFVFAAEIAAVLASQ